MARQPSGPAPLPAVPADGAITQFALADAVGTIVLDGGRQLRFGRSACEFEPVVGSRIRVHAVAPGVAGRIRATRVELLDSADAHADQLAARDVAAGFAGAPAASSAEVLQQLRLGVTTTVGLHDVASLRAWWRDAGLDGVAPLTFTPSPGVQLGARQWQIVFGAGFDKGVLDVRFGDGQTPSGAGFVGVLGIPTRLVRLTELRMPSAWGMGSRGDARALLQLIERLSARPDVDGTVAGFAGSLWLPASEWRRRLGDSTSNPIPVEAWLDVAFGPSAGGLRLRSFGMAALGLPDVEIDDASATEDDDAYDLAQALVWTACRILVGEDERAGIAPHVAFCEGEHVRLWLDGQPFDVAVIASGPDADVVVLGAPTVRTDDEG